VTAQERTLHAIVLGIVLNFYVRLPRKDTEQLVRDIVAATLKHLHETGAMSVPPEDLQ